MRMLIFFLVHLLFCKISAAPLKKYESIISFGDSLTDTGNLLISGDVASPDSGRLPYGQTFFKYPTGRLSDGRLIIDFIAEASGLPYLPPSLAVEKGEKVEHGVNFAVAGATALDAKYFYEQGIRLMTNYSLSVQIGWFKKLKPTLCTTKQECDNYFKRCLIVMGEIGGIDFNYPFLAGATTEQLKPMVPLVVQAVATAATAVIEDGAVNVMIPGDLPKGCNPILLTTFRTANKSVYDENWCLKAYNNFAMYYNHQLQLALEKLRQKYKHARIIYADYYGAAIPLFRVPKLLGFTNGGLVACCGGGGPYNFNSSARCGHVGSTVCDDPSSYVIWDGGHLTEAAYRFIARGLIFGPFTYPPLFKIN